MSDNHTLWIYGAVGSMFGPDAVTANSVREQLAKVRGGQRLTIRINSPGGEVDDAVAIHTLLSEHPAEKLVKIDGVAASAASLIAMVGDQVEIARGAKMMIHNPWAVAVGDHRELRRAADVAERYAESAAGIYAARSHRSPRAIRAAMDETTYFLSDEALEWRFADRITDQRAVAASSTGQVTQQAQLVARMAFAEMLGQAPAKIEKTFDAMAHAARRLALARARYQV